MGAQTIAPRTRVSQAASPATGVGESQGAGHFPALQCLQTHHQTYSRALCFAVGLLPAAVRGTPGALSRSNHQRLHENSQV